MINQEQREKLIERIKEVRSNLREVYDLAPSVHILSASTLLGKYKDLLSSTESKGEGIENALDDIDLYLDDCYNDNSDIHNGIISVKIDKLRSILLPTPPSSTQDMGESV